MRLRRRKSEDPRIARLLREAEQMERGHAESMDYRTGNMMIDIEETRARKVRAAGLRAEALVLKLRG